MAAADIHDDDDDDNADDDANDNASIDSEDSDGRYDGKKSNLVDPNPT